MQATWVSCSGFKTLNCQLKSLDRENLKMGNREWETERGNGFPVQFAF